MTPIEVKCRVCGKPATATIDELHAAEWTWYSSATERFFVCKECASDPAKINEHRAACRIEHEKANVDPRREEKMKARAAAKSALEANRG